ncbi:MAG: transcriptional regulator [Deltaproteobacteria bacterium]|nr:transcriptional regulator [Deltaproteobacteria bacterium]
MEPTTLRRQMEEFLRQGAATARDISKALSVPEKEVYRHLDHIAKSTAGRGRRLVVSPWKCKGCGFAFNSREKLAKPSRCPKCRQERFENAEFSIG